MKKNNKEAQLFYRFRIFLIFLIVFIFAALFVVSKYTAQKPFSFSKKKLSLIEVKQRVPYRPKGLINNKPNSITYINYWAVWCEPCLNELPIIIRAKQEALKRNWPINFVFYNLDSPSFLSLAKEFIKKKLDNQIPLKQSKLTEQVVKINKQLPHHQIIDLKQRLAMNWSGEIQSEDQILSILKKLLNEK